MLISEKEIEIERLKTTVVSLNIKCQVTQSIEKEVQKLQKMHENSEIDRVKLQNHVHDLGICIKNDADSHNKFEEQLMQQIKEL